LNIPLLYFTEIGANNILSEYNKLIGNEYLFKEGVFKMKLLSIQKLPGIAIEKNGFTIFFFADKANCDIKSFMLLNAIPYNYNAYDHFYYETK